MIYIRGCTQPNLGDSANKELVRALTGETPKLVNNNYKIPENEINYLVMGSVLGWADKNSIIWGAGKMSNTEATMFKEKPKEIKAVRGPYTRTEILKFGYKCPEVYGDPFLLMPLFYPVLAEKKYKLGIVPHIIELSQIPQLKQQFPNANIIELNKPVLECIKEINSCEMIASSALHGIICADAYEIPNVQIKLSNKILGAGFKYLDYYTSINRWTSYSIELTKSVKEETLIEAINKWQKPEIDLSKLLEVCPFKRT